MSVVGSPTGSGRALRLDPLALPHRYAAQDEQADDRIRTIEIGESGVAIRRSIGGVAADLSAPMRDFIGVGIRLTPAADDAPASAAVMLEHADPTLCVPVFVATDADDLLAEWSAWARVLGLPRLLPGRSRTGAGLLPDDGSAPARRHPRPPPAPRRDPLASPLDPVAAQARPDARRAGGATRRARDHRPALIERHGRITLRG